MPTDARAARLYANELRRDWEHAWEVVYHRYYAAEAYWSYSCHAARAAVIERRTQNTPEAQEERLAFRRRNEAIGPLMLMPALKIGDLRLKQKLAGVGGGQPEWDAAIAADLARLGPGPGPRRKRAEA